METKRYQHLPTVLENALKIAYEKNSWKIVPLLLDNSDLSDWTDWTHKFLAEGPCNKLWEQAFEKLAKADGEDNGKIEVKSLVEWIKSLELNSEDEYFLDISPNQIERIVKKVKCLHFKTAFHFDEIFAISRLITTTTVKLTKKNFLTS